MELPDESLVKHQEGETSPANQGAGPAIVGAVQAVEDLVYVITGAHSPFPVVVLPQVVAVLELAWIAIGLGRSAALSGVEWCNVVHVVVINTLRGRETLVVERRVVRSPVRTS